ncbi:hypothetical protein KF728_25460 [Candidatus Obscuribacterales bacterium]|nr:hypothetical protein [Candidatus Obscuribacterales bacterium]MBX3153526.1 hypothetical protein [Candidatus Obscuribacterales bacterium]
MPERKIYLTAASTSGWDVIIECSGGLDDVVSFTHQRQAETYARYKSGQLGYEIILIGRDGVRRRLVETVSSAETEAGNQTSLQQDGSPHT